MGNYGIKISKPGYDVKELDANNENRNLSFTSKYDVLKVHSVGSGTFNTGSSATIAHGLGYPGAFVVYLSSDNTNWNIYDGRSYIDSTNLVITKDRDLTTNYYYHETNYDAGFTIDSDYFVGYGGGVGKSGIGGEVNGALRFVGVNETSNITSATLGVKISGSRSGTVIVTTYGIDEDNTGDFGGNPLGRSRTTAVVNNSCDNGITDIWAYDVTDIFKEIANRGGWSSGNAMGFLTLNNGNTDGHVITTSLESQGTYLKTTKLADVSTMYYKYVIFKNKLDSTKTI